jgi:hypothetical protein
LTEGGHTRFPKSLIASVEADPEVSEGSLRADAGAENRFRLWTSANGKFKVEAEFLEFAGGSVKLKKVNGSVITVAFDKLSETDRGWIRTRTQAE